MSSNPHYKPQNLNAPVVVIGDPNNPVPVQIVGGGGGGETQDVNVVNQPLDVNVQNQPVLVNVNGQPIGVNVQNTSPIPVLLDPSGQPIGVNVQNTPIPVLLDPSGQPISVKIPPDQQPISVNVSNQPIGVNINNQPIGVNVQNTPGVNITNQPIGVNVQNQPLGVNIQNQPISTYAHITNQPLQTVERNLNNARFLIVLGASTPGDYSVVGFGDETKTTNSISFIGSGDGPVRFYVQNAYFDGVGWEDIYEPVAIHWWAVRKIITYWSDGRITTDNPNVIPPPDYRYIVIDQNDPTLRPQPILIRKYLFAPKFKKIKRIGVKFSFNVQTRGGKKTHKIQQLPLKNDIWLGSIYFLDGGWAYGAGGGVILNFMYSRNSKDGASFKITDEELYPFDIFSEAISPYQQRIQFWIIGGNPLYGLAYGLPTGLPYPPTANAVLGFYKFFEGRGWRTASFYCLVHFELEFEALSQHSFGEAP